MAWPATVLSAHPLRNQTLGCAGLMFQRQVVEKKGVERSNMQASSRATSLECSCWKCFGMNPIGLDLRA